MTRDTANAGADYGAGCAPVTCHHTAENASGDRADDRAFGLGKALAGAGFGGPGKTDRGSDEREPGEGGGKA
jgi:hypothetical protein